MARQRHGRRGRQPTISTTFGSHDGRLVGSNFTTDADVATAVLRCAIETSDQLRTPAGPDATAIAERRRSVSEQAFLEKQRGLIWLLVSDTDRRLIANSPLTTSTSLPAVSRPSTSGRPTKKPDSGLPPMPCAILRRPTSPASTSWTPNWP